jgi:transcriptional regulator with XRE-family HTH domain
MRRETRAIDTQQRAPEPLPFAVALGHRLRQVRENAGHTAADVAAAAQLLGLSWDRSTVARIELGQRNVTAAELLAMTQVYDVAVADLLPTEAARLTDVLTATPAGLADSLTGAGPHDGWDFERGAEVIMDAFRGMADRLNAVQARLPGARLLTIAAAAKHFRDETTTKAARRLDATAEEVAVAAQQLWQRSLAAERDARVEAMGPVTSARARQARRGHVTRAMLDDLAPQVLALRTRERS